MTKLNQYSSSILRFGDACMATHLQMGVEGKAFANTLPSTPIRRLHHILHVQYGPTTWSLECWILGMRLLLATLGCQKLQRAVKSFGLSKAAKGCQRQGTRATHSTKSIYIDDGGKGLSE